MNSKLWRALVIGVVALVIAGLLATGFCVSPVVE